VPDAVGERAPDAAGERAPDAAPVPVPAKPVPRADLEKIIERAAELQFRADGSEAGELDESELVRIGGEVGLDARYVRQALAERTAGKLVPELPEDAGLPARLWGVGVVRASRVVPGSPAEVSRRIEAHFVRRERLRQVRDRPGRSLWEPATDMLSNLRRQLDFGGYGYALAKARRLDLSVQPLEEARSLVTLTADLRGRRAGQVLGWLGAALPVAVGGAVGLTLGAGLPVLIAVPLAGLPLVGAGSWAVGRTFGKVCAQVELAIQGLLDRLEGGLPLDPGRPGLWERLTSD